MALIDKAAMEQERLRSLARTFARANTTLTGRRVTVECKVEDRVKAPAYSIGDQIVLNLAHIGSIDTTDDIIKVTGLDFHELAHAEYTPRKGSFIVQQVQRNNAWQTFNLLEDQRIESLLVAKYTSLKPYFVMAVMEYIAKPGSDLSTAHALTHGRRYLPVVVRQAIRAKFQHPNILKEMEGIIDDYRKIVYPMDNNAGLDLVLRMDRLLQSNVQRPIDDPHGHSTKSRPDGEGEAKPGQAQQQESKQIQAQKQREKQDKKEGKDDEDYLPQDHASGGDDDDDEWDEDGDDGTDDGDDTDDHGDASDDDEADSEDEGAGDPEGAESEDSDDGEGDESAHDGTGDGDGDGDADSDDGGSGDSGRQGDGDGSDDGVDGESTPGDTDSDTDAAGSSNHRGDPSLLDDDDLRDLAQDIAQRAANRPEVQADARTKKEAIKRINGELPAIDSQHYSSAAAEADYMIVSNQFKRELMKVWADADPGWKQHKASGRVNVQRAMRGGEIDTLFDQWDEGNNDATDIELIVLFDYSYSMNRQMKKASQALWAIKRAVESIGGDVTVIGYSDGATLFYDKMHKAKARTYRLFGADSGTDPQEALDQARLMMHYSKKKHRIVLFLTDGSWDRHYGGPLSVTHEQQIEQLKAHGVITALAYLGRVTEDSIEDMTDDEKMSLFHGVHTYAPIHDPKGLVTLAKGIVKMAMQQRVA
jgi:hypothetical protein